MAFFGSSWFEGEDDDRGMPMFSACRGECRDCVTFYSGTCLAGHGDDDFSPITEEQAFEIIKRKTKDNASDLDWTISELKVKFPNLEI